MVILADSCGTSQDASGSEIQWGSILGDRWVFAPIAGQLRVTEVSINNPPPTDVHYSFEDGTVGCWILSQESGRYLGSDLSSSTTQRHAGARALSLKIDLSRPGEHRARIEHHTSQPLKGIRQMSAWVYFASDGQAQALQPEFFVWDGSTWHPSRPDLPTLQPNRWTKVEATTFSPPLEGVETQRLGLEIKLPDGVDAQNVRGTIYIDDLTIEAAGQ